jgi:hypothetical protein
MRLLRYLLKVLLGIFYVLEPDNRRHTNRLEEVKFLLRSILDGGKQEFELQSIPKGSKGVLLEHTDMIEDVQALNYGALICRLPRLQVI